MLATYILNATQHASTPEQRATDLSVSGRETLQRLLTFDEPPTQSEMRDRAHHIVCLLMDEEHLIATEAAATNWSIEVEGVMIGGAPFFMPVLQDALRQHGYKPLYAFSKRESVDLPDGTKRSRFVHAGWVEA